MKTTNRLNVLCDMDGVLVDLLPTWLRIYGDYTGDYVHPDEITDYQYEKFVKEPEALIGTLQTALLQAPPMPGSAAIFALARNPRVELELVSFIHPVMDYNVASRIKRQWLNRWFPGLLNAAPLYFTGAARAEMGADVLIDDSPTNVEAFLKAEPRGMAYIIEHAYNHKYAVNRQFDGDTRFWRVPDVRMVQVLIDSWGLEGKAA